MKIILKDQYCNDKMLHTQFPDREDLVAHLHGTEKLEVRGPELSDTIDDIEDEFGFEKHHSRDCYRSVVFSFSNYDTDIEVFHGGGGGIRSVGHDDEDYTGLDGWAVEWWQEAADEVVERVFATPREAVDFAFEVADRLDFG